VGSNERHGPHNFLGTDHLIAKAVAEETAKRTGVICLQVIPFGVSYHQTVLGHSARFTGNLQNYLKEICLALNYYGIRKIVIVNGRGGNLAALADLARELREKGVFISIFQWWTAASKLLPQIFKPVERGHAGAEETSVNLALHPHLVRMDKAVDEETRSHFAEVAGITLPLDTADHTASGVFGKFTTASAEKGREVFEVVVNELARHVDMLKDAKIEDLMAKPKV